jgi:hypothetical protein
MARRKKRLRLTKNFPFVAFKGASRKRAWYTSCRWSVEANFSTGTNAGPRRGWQEIYCAPTKARAKADAQGWQQRTGQTVRIVPGAGHRTRR